MAGGTLNPKLHSLIYSANHGEFNRYYNLEAIQHLFPRRLLFILQLESKVNK